MKTLRSLLEQSVDTKKLELQASRDNTNIKPTKNEIEDQSYKKGLFQIQGLSIRIENPKGSVRSGKDKDGNKWSREMTYDYGYFDRSLGKDGDQVDVFIGPNLDSREVFIVDQIDSESGKFDEHKVMFGFNSIGQARNAYKTNYDQGWQGLGAISSMTISEFRYWLGGGTRTKVPVKYKVKSTTNESLTDEFIAKPFFKQYKRLKDNGEDSELDVFLRVLNIRELNALANYCGLGTSNNRFNLIDTLKTEQIHPLTGILDMKK